MILNVVYDFVQYLPTRFGVMLRSALVSRLVLYCGKNLAVRQGVTIHIPQNLILGSNVEIMDLCQINCRGRVVIQDNVLIASRVVILSGNHEINMGIVQRDSYKTYLTVVQNGAWIGTGAIILPGRTIGMHAIVGAGSVVTKDVPAGEVWAGNPARKIRTA